MFFVFAFCLDTVFSLKVEVLVWAQPSVYEYE